MSVIKRYLIIAVGISIGIRDIWVELLIDFDVICEQGEFLLVELVMLVFYILL